MSEQLPYRISVGRDAGKCIVCGAPFVETSPAWRFNSKGWLHACPSKEMLAAVPFTGPGTYNLVEMKQTIERLTDALAHARQCPACRDDGWGLCDQGRAAEELLRKTGRLP